ncbi:GNAT family N-acetyltransferase [uncultured Vibrio sp.]|uniref:GNAT family N-acetyltransferase n=1 Tax=uncultured Vibrio sp. TaxID=114054 RepID=UPI0025E75117|nr:GNAT family N-acetyltransferase [uncultured Vibrio sp.]
MNYKQISTLELDELTDLFSQYMAFYQQPSNPTRFREYLTQRLERNEATVYIAYDEGNLPAGFVLNYHSFSSLSLSNVIILNDLFVVSAARGKGVARGLINCSIELAKSTGAVCVDLGTAKDNLTAQALYEKIGFVKDTKYYSYSLTIK